MTSSFSNLSLAPELARAVAEMGYETMTPIQEQAIPVVLQGKDVMGAAQTGTGKTAAFALPLLQRMMKHENASASPARHPVRALVLLPTRELAVQVAQQVELYAKYTNLRSTVVFGGMDMKPQTAELKKVLRCWSPHLGACWTILRLKTRCSIKSSMWCSTKLTACLTLASCLTCNAS